MSAGQSSAPALLPIRKEGSHSATPDYTEFHPRWYRPKVSTYWWLGKWAYVKFILRELTSVAVAWTVGLMLLQIYTLVRGGPTYDLFLQLMSQPWMIAINIFAFAFLLMHSITWFNLAPKAMAVRVHGKRIPAMLIAGPQYVAWLAISAIVVFIISRLD